MIQKEQMMFQSRHFNLFGALYIPEHLNKSEKHPAIVVSHPSSSNSEQTSSIYATGLAEKGFVAMTFDASYQGRSEGHPRYLEDPSVRTEDISYAIDYLATLDWIDSTRIGAAGICAGGGYTINAAKTDRRIKAVASIAGANIGNTYREAFGPDEQVITMLEQAASQRTAEVQGADPLEVNWIPNSPEELKEAGYTDIDYIEAVDYYRTARGFSNYSPNLIRFTSFAHVLGFDANTLIEKLLTQPLQIIVGDKPGTFASYRNGFEVYNRAASKQKDILVLQGISHYDLYDQPKAVNPALEKLNAFFTEYLGK